MTRINTNVPSLRGLRNLQASSEMLQTSLQRLSTGLKINSGKDNPAGLIASEKLHSQISSIEQSIKNSNRANTVIGTADGALGEISSLLNQVRALVQEGLNDGALSQSEIEANQLQIDNALSAINRIAANTTFAGDKLIDGSKEFQTTTGDSSEIDDVHVSEALFGSSSTITVNVSVSTAATKGQIEYRTGTLGSSNDVVFEIAGAKGSQVLFVDGGSTASQIADAVNSVSDVTGVDATVTSGTVVFTSQKYGSNEFVDVNLLSGTFATVDSGGTSATRDAGSNVAATINGQSATGDGLRTSVKTATLDFSLDLDATAGNVASNTLAVTITGGGALFQIGQEVSAGGQIGIGIEAVNTARLGGVSGKLYELGTGGGKSLVDATTSTSVQGSDLVKIVEEAIDRVSNQRGRLGAIQKNVIETNVNTLGVALENITEARSAILDTDFATETANMTRAQILQQAGISVLAIANQNPANVLSLLG